MIRLRFAPSPTGFVHVGNARTALFNYLHCRNQKGALVLRIEDTDVERSRKEYEENLIRDLKWLGLQWDEGPASGGEYGPYRQSERTGIYRKYARQLIDEARAYYCFCSAEELEKEKQMAASADASGVSAHKCRQLDMNESGQRVQQGEAAAIRFKIPQNVRVTFRDLVRGEVHFDSNLLNDPVILRSTGMPAYNFSVVIDDRLMKIDLVVRGEDHLSNTARQVLIYRAFGFELPQFAHLPMVMGADNSRLSKRHGSTSIAQFREEGYLPSALFNYLALLGWSPGDDREVLPRQELIERFNLTRVSKSAAIFDYQKLKWMNREHIRLLEDEHLGRLMTAFLKGQGFRFDESGEILDWVGRTAGILSSYHYLLSDIAAGFRVFADVDDRPELIRQILDSETAYTVISRLHENIAGLDSPIEFSKVAAITKTIQQETGIKGKELYHPIRLALTGKDSGIELQDFIPTIEKGSVLQIKPTIRNMKTRLAIFLR
jgi:glutamyl-tRNA synthetase